MKFRKRGLLVVLVLVAILFLFNRKDVVYSGQKMSIHPLGPSGYELKSDISLYNGNLLSSTIQSIYQEVEINGQKAGVLDNQIVQGIPGGKETVFPVSIRFSAASVSALTGKSIAGQMVEVRLTGKIVFENIIGGGTIKINQKDSVYVSAL